MSFPRLLKCCRNPEAHAQHHAGRSDVITRQPFDELALQQRHGRVVEHLLDAFELRSFRKRLLGFAPHHADDVSRSERNQHIASPIHCLFLGHQIGV